MEYHFLNFKCNYLLNNILQISKLNDSSNIIVNAKSQNLKVLI